MAKFLSHTKADLATAPRASAGFEPLSIDLSGNERLVVLGPGALSDFPSLERVALPYALTYLAEDALPMQLFSVVFREFLFREFQCLYALFRLHDV